MTLEEAIAKIKPLDHNAMEIAQKRWDSIAKPLHSLGKLETLLIQIAGITGNAEVDLSRRGLIAMCADNGVRTSEHRSMYSYVRLSIDRCTATYV